MVRHTDVNRQAKRDQIVAAAKDVLAREGVAACTARAVADASPLTKSAIHYYFDDINEIVDQAMLAHVTAMVADLRRVAAEPADPRARLFAVVDAYLATFAGQPHAAFVWFEYWITAGRREARAGAAAMLDQVRVLLRELLADLPVAEPEQAADTLLSWLLGTIVQQHLRPRAAERLHHELGQLLAAGQ